MCFGGGADDRLGDGLQGQEKGEPASSLRPRLCEQTHRPQCPGLMGGGGGPSGARAGIYIFCLQPGDPGLLPQDISGWWPVLSKLPWLPRSSPRCCGSSEDPRPALGGQASLQLCSHRCWSPAMLPQFSPRSHAPSPCPSGVSQTWVRPQQAPRGRPSPPGVERNHCHHTAPHNIKPHTDPLGLYATMKPVTNESHTQLQTPSRSDEQSFVSCARR